MGNTSYGFNDYIKDLAAASITVTNENTNYPKTNMQDEQIALTTRTTNKTAIKIQLDLGAAKQPKFFFIGNHNFSGGTFDINSYTANDFSTGKIQVEANKAVRLLDVYHRESAAPAARQYWEFDLTNVTSTDSYYEWGRAMLYDDLVQLTNKEDYSESRGYGYENIVNETAFKIRWVHKMIEKRERFELRWGERYAVTLATELRTLYESVYGNAHPLVFIPDISGTPCYYVYIESPELLYAQIYGMGSYAHTGDVVLQLIEAVRGKA